MSSPDKQPRIAVEDFDDVPDFASEAEEAEYWATHELAGAALEQMRPLDEVLPSVARRHLRDVG